MIRRKQVELHMRTYLIAIGTQSRNIDEPIDVMPTRPLDNAPREAPNLLSGSYNNMHTYIQTYTHILTHTYVHSIMHWRWKCLANG